MSLSIKSSDGVKEICNVLVPPNGKSAGEIVTVVQMVARMKGYLQRGPHVLTSQDLVFLQDDIVFVSVTEERATQFGTKSELNVAPSNLTNSECAAFQHQDELGSLRHLQSPGILNFRPSYAEPSIPLSLVHPTFGRFLDIYRGVSGKPSHEDYRFFVGLAAKCSVYWKVEAVYGAHVRSLWQKYAGMDVESELNTGGRTSADMGFCHMDIRALFGLAEAKVAMCGNNQSDPAMQGAQNYRRYWAFNQNSAVFNGSRYPALIIEHVGPFIRVSAVAILEKLSFMPLTPFINLLLLQGHDLAAAEQGARLCLATKVALQEFSGYYRGFTSRTIGTQWLPTPYPLLNQRVLTRFGKKLLYLIIFNGVKVVVKFVQRPYGEAVHRAWASAGLAPALHEVRAISGGWQQVTMEYLEGWKMMQGHPEAELLRPSVLAALTKAQSVQVGPSGAVGVHGDMRDVNVMVKGSPENVEVKFIDFDWAKEVGSEALYPSFMNHESVAWPEGAEEHLPMLQIHDTELLSKPQPFQSM